MKKLLILLLLAPIFALSQIDLNKEEIRSEFYCLLNADRESKNLSKLLSSPKLNAIAHIHTKYMAFQGELTHFEKSKENPFYYGTNPSDRGVNGECIMRLQITADMQEDEVAFIIYDRWRESNKHYNILLMEGMISGLDLIVDNLSTNDIFYPVYVTYVANYFESK